MTPAGDIVQAADGKVLARKLSGLDYCAPLVVGRTVYFVQNGGKAVQLPEAMGEKFEPATLWETKPENERYYASPVLCDGLLYAATRKQAYSVIDATNGSVVCTTNLALGGEVYTSITRAGPYIYVSSDKGTTVVFQPGRELKEIARNRLEEFRSTPLFVGERMYVRGREYFYCIGK